MSAERRIELLHMNDVIDILVSKAKALVDSKNRRQNVEDGRSPAHISRKRRNLLYTNDFSLIDLIMKERR